MRVPLEIHIADRHVTARNGAASDAQSERCPLADTAANLEPDALAEAILETVEKLEPPHRRATLIIPSSWCYVQRVDLPQRRPSRDMLAYALEEYLPVELESLTCDFIRAGNGDLIGVAIETQQLRPLLDALSAGNITVERITLDILHAAQQRKNPGRLLWCDDEHVAVLTAADNAPADLRVVRLAADLSAEQWCRRVVGYVGNGSESQADHPAAAVGSVTAERLASLSEAARIEVGPGVERTKGHNSAWPDFDLARGDLAPARQRIDLLRTWRRTAMLVLVALLVLSVGLAIQRSRLEDQIRTITAWENDLFGQLFPGQPVPAGIALRLASERRRLEGLTLAGTATPTQQQDAMDTLRTIVAALPGDLRLDLQEIRIDGRDVTMRGRTRDHHQAERMAAAINTTDLACAAPRTDRDRGGGVRFFLHARQPDASEPPRRASP